MERSKAGTKEKRSPDGLNYPNQSTIIINIICKYFVRDGKSTMKFNEQKTKWTLTIEKWQIIHPPLTTRCIAPTNRYWYKGKVFYGQEPPSGEYTATECGVNYQLLAVIYWSSPMGNSWLQLTTTIMDKGAKDGRSNWLVGPPPSWAALPQHLVHSINQCSLSGNRPWNFSMLGNHLAYVATHGIIELKNFEGLKKFICDWEPSVCWNIYCY